MEEAGEIITEKLKVNGKKKLFGGGKWWGKVVLVVLGGLAIANLAFIDYTLVFEGVPGLKWRMDLVEKRLDSLIKREVPVDTESEVVEVNEERLVNKAVEQALEETEKLIASSLPTPTPTPVAQVVESKASSVKEFFVPIGSGSTQSKDWADIYGAEVVVDSRRYGEIAAVYFEASLHVVNGNVSARLLNVNDGLVFYDGVVTHNTSTSTLITSNAIRLPSGIKTYRVQMRSDSGEWAYMDQSRLRILVK